MTDRVFLQTSAGLVTHAEFDRLVQRRMQKDLDPAITATPTVETVVDLFAVSQSGRTAVVLDPRLPEAERTLRSTYAGEDGDHSILFTSGTSGQPKGVRLTHKNWEAQAVASASHLRHTPDDRWLCSLPIAHVGGLSILIRSRREGSTVLLEAGFDPTRCARLLEDGAATLASLVPTMLRRILDTYPGPYHGVRAVLVGGASCPQSLLDRAAAAGLPVLPVYGMTETASQIASGRMEDGLRPFRRAYPLPGAELQIGIGGRIACRGPMVSPGYVGERPRRAEEWFVTEDLGEIGADGGLRVLGRADEAINTGGEKVHPAAIASILADHPLVQDAAVVGIPDEEWGEVVAVAYVGDVSAQELENWAGDRLAGFEVPKRWVDLDHLPRDQMGKLDRRALAGLFGLAV